MIALRSRANVFLEACCHTDSDISIDDATRNVATAYGNSEVRIPAGVAAILSADAI